jgi:DNA-binding CsgD family transcriptional regulator
LSAKRKDGSLFDAQISANMFTDDDDGLMLMMASFLDITKHKQAVKALRQREEELKIKTNNLQEVNVALKVLLQKRDEDKIKLEEKVLYNVKELIFPYVEKLKGSGLDRRQINLVSIIESNLDEVTAPLLSQFALKYSNLTPKEIQVANLVKRGKTTKEIAKLLISGTDAIEFHRKNLRMKLGLKNTKSNLRSYLLSLN